MKFTVCVTNEGLRVVRMTIGTPHPFEVILVAGKIETFSPECVHSKRLISDRVRDSGSVGSLIGSRGTFEEIPDSDCSYTNQTDLILESNSLNASEL